MNELIKFTGKTIFGLFLLGAGVKLIQDGLENGKKIKF